MMLKRKEQILLLFLFLIILGQSQNNVCYSNCKEGYCQEQSPSNCTACDKGQLNLNGRCVSSSSQPYPLKFLTANKNQSISGVNSQSNIFSCTIFKTVQNSLNPLATLLYQIVPGATYTKQFYIVQRHQYIQIKFNAAIVQESQTIIEYQLLSGDGTIILSGRQSSQPSNDITQSIQCNGNNTVYGVFYVTKTISTTQQNLTLQIKSLDANAVFGVSNFQIYYGSCNKKCKTCSGPQQTECLSCRGLYMQLVNGTCQTCPTGHYDSGSICRLCPKNCQACTFNNQTQKVTCTSCLPWSQLNQGSCTQKYESYSLPEELMFNSSQNWKSSQLTSQPLTVCGQYSLIGGIPMGRQGSVISKTFTNLLVHSQVNIRLVFWMIDQQPDDQNLYQILVDGVIIKQQQLNITPEQSNWVLSNECGNSNPQFQFIVSLNSIPHQGRNITISITSVKKFFGFRDLTLIVNNKTSVAGCQTQTNGVCTSCQRGFKYNPTKKTCSECSEGYYLTKNKDSCQICPIECKTCQLQTGLDKIICLSCVSPLELMNGYCKDTSGAIYGRDIIPDGIKPLKQNKWKLYPKLPNKGITTCGNKSILGSNEIRYKFLQMDRQYNNLPSHRGIKVYFHFYQIDTFTNESVYFVINGKRFNYTPSLERKQICGDSHQPDAIVKLEYLDQEHTDGSFLFEIYAVGKIKFGVNNFVLFLLNCDGCNNVVQYEIESIPIYSLSTPPIKGIEVKILVDQQLKNSTPISSAFQFSISKPTQQQLQQQQQINTTTRLLQGLIQFNQNLPIAWQEVVANRQYRSFLQLSHDYIDSQITVDPVNFWALSTEPNLDDTNKLLSSKPVTNKMPRYMDIDQNNVDNRTNIRNFRNLFQGCAILALWIGLVSFLVGFSCAFDDFFILVQVIFVHIFIQLPYSPPSLRLPLQGMQIVQFMAWLPWQARVQIQKGIIPDNLYQRSPIVYEQYYKDIVYARTIYHTILFFVYMIVIFILLKVITHTLTSSPKSKRKYADSYIVKYCTDYESNQFSYIDKFVRFAYFTIIWACVLQFTIFQNSPNGFNIWNSILCIFMFIIFVLYPIGGFLWLRKMSGEMSDSTFRKKYDDIRIHSNRLFYFIWRYYKLLLIALLIGLLYDSNPVGILIPLIIVHVVDGLIIIFLKPFGMEQQQQLNVCLYNYYPKVYQISSAVQSFLFAFLELFILITYAVRDSATNYAYLGLGYFCCVLIILLLINGLLKLVWGFIKIVEGCFAKSKQMKLLVQNKALKQKQINQEMVPMKSIKQLQSNLNNLQSRSRLNTLRKTTLVSKIS